MKLYFLENQYDMNTYQYDADDQHGSYSDQLPLDFAGFNQRSNAAFVVT